MRALIFSTHTGGGHDAAARAIQQALEAYGVETKIMDCVAFGGAWLSRVVSDGYVKLVQHYPDGFGKMYHIGEVISTPRMKSPIYLMNSAYAFRMVKEIMDFGTDMIICTHLFGGQSVTHLRKHGQYKGFFAMVMTDYTFMPFLEDIRPDVLCVSHRAMMKECREKGLPEGILMPFGIPVSPDCKPCTDRAAAKRKVGIDPATPHVLLVGGSMGAGNLPGIVARLMPSLPGNARLTLVCGSNTAAKEQAEKLLSHDRRAQVLGRVTPLYDLMAAADVLITKSGGLTTTEAMTIGTPMVIVHPIRGCETENATFFERMGLALYARSLDELPEKTSRLLSSQEARERMIATQHREIDPECSMHFAAYLVEKTRQRMED